MTIYTSTRMNWKASLTSGVFVDLLRRGLVGGMEKKGGRLSDETKHLVAVRVYMVVVSPHFTTPK